MSFDYDLDSLNLRKDFWRQLVDFFGLTYPKGCIRSDFNVIRGVSVESGGLGLPSVRGILMVSLKSAN